MNLSARFTLIMLILCGGLLSQISFAQNKVVVVPLDADEKISGRQKIVSFTGSSLGLSGATRTFEGVEFENGVLATARINMQRPLDWDQSSDVVVTMLARADSTGSERFFIRPRDYNDGDTFSDAIGIFSNTVGFTSGGQYKELTVTIGAGSLPKDWWELVIQRDNGFGANSGDITIVSVSVAYTTQ